MAEHIYEVIGFSENGQCTGHAWVGDGRCPYCDNPHLGYQRNLQIVEMALELLIKQITPQEQNARKTN